MGRSAVASSRPLALITAWLTTAVRAACMQIAGRLQRIGASRPTDLVCSGGRRLQLSVCLPEHKVDAAARQLQTWVGARGVEGVLLGAGVHLRVSLECCCCYR